MIYSMTGYGSAKVLKDSFTVSVEIKSVNNRYFETNIRMPRNFLFYEEAVKSQTKNFISRGKIDVFITVNSFAEDDVKVDVNMPLLNAYINAVNEIGKEFSLDNDISAVTAAKMPDVLSVEKTDARNEIICEGIKEAVDAALESFNNMRLREGEKLKADIQSRLVTISECVQRVDALAPETVERYRKRLVDKMESVLSDTSIAEDRILAEAAIFADHIAVDEETVRLKSHIDQMNGMCNGNSPIGKNMDFLIQEFNREANTIGSKCQSSDISAIVISIKSEIEKIREQIQNIE